MCSTWVDSCFCWKYSSRLEILVSGKLYSLTNKIHIIASMCQFDIVSVNIYTHGFNLERDLKISLFALTGMLKKLTNKRLLNALFLCSFAYLLRNQNSNL